MRQVMSFLLLVLAAGALTAGSADRCLDVTAGAVDAFTLPVEPTHPSSQYVQRLSRVWPQPLTREFDGTGIDMALVHTFSGWRGRVCSATLEIGLRADVSPLVTNDSVRLVSLPANDYHDAFRYWTTIRYVTGSWEPGDQTVLTLDLADLPPYGGFPTNILSDLTDGSLDFMVEDDTDVDYATLTVCLCRGVSLPTAVLPAIDGARTLGPGNVVSWGTIKARY